jgi:hypothetical protein
VLNGVDIYEIPRMKPTERFVALPTTLTKHPVRFTLREHIG